MFCIPFKTNIGQIPSDSVQGPSKRPSSGLLYPVSSVKERNRKGGKSKISWVLQSPVPSTQASPKVEASHRPKQAQHFFTCRKVQNGNTRVHQDLPDSRGMGIVDRPVGCLPYLNSRKYLRFCYKSRVFQFTSLPFGLGTVLVATDNSTVVAYTNKQGGTHSEEMCALLWKIMTWCHHYHITLKARHIPGCLNVMADLLSRSNQVQSTEWSLHPYVTKVVHTSCRPICHSSEPQASTVRISCPRPKVLGHRCSEHKLDRSHYLCLPSNSSPSQADPKNQAMLLPDNRNSPRLARDALVLGPSAALNRDPTATPSVNNSSQQSHNYVCHCNPQYLNLHAWCLGVDSCKNKASLWRC